MSWKYTLSCLPLLVFLSCVNGQIKNGRNAKEREIPYQVAIRHKRGNNFKGRNMNTFFAKNGIFCGGSVINTRWVMSAAHCLKTTKSDFFVEAYEITAGSIHAEKQEDNDFGRRTFLSTTFYYHEEFRYTSKKWSEHRYDIGLLLLETRISYSNWIQPVF